MNQSINLTENKQEISSKFIYESLDFYNEEHTFLKKCTYQPDLREFNATFQYKTYPFTKNDYLPYLTVPLLMLFISQGGYVLSRLIMRESFKDIDYADNLYFDKRNNGNIVFRKFSNINFNKKNHEKTITINFKYYGLLHNNNRWFVNVDFKVEDFSEGNFKVAII